MSTKKILAQIREIWVELAVRIALFIIFINMEKVKPFQRKIHPDELWLYRNPLTPSYVPSSMLWPLVVFAPFAVLAVFYLLRKDVSDAVQGFLSFSLALGLNGIVTDIVKLVVGRPRPDFFWRCFPDGHSNDEMLCTGNVDIINEGRKSFPSGHSSFSFASLGFVSLYLCGKLGVFNQKGRGKSLRLFTALIPVLIALTVALSRTCDYHHHWQDVLCGSLLGMGITYLCYRQYYPSLEQINADIPLIDSVTLPTVNSNPAIPSKWI